MTEKESKDKKKEENKDEEVKVPAKFKDIVDKIEKMSVLDLSELVKLLEKKFGVSAQPTVVASGAVAGAGAQNAANQESEKSEFNVVLTGIGDKKIEVIKAVRDITQKGLKECKDLVDAAATKPQIIEEGAEKAKAEEAKKKLEAAGAKVELK